MKLLKVCIVLATLISSFHLQAGTSTNKIFLSSCFHSGDGVSFSFASCVNRNFNEVGRELGGFYSYCSNFGQEVSYSYLSCIERNFRAAEREAQGNLYLRYCTNFERERLGFSYVSCVNSNFREIERHLNTL